MSNEALIRADEKPFFSPDQEKIILNTFLGGASREEAQVLLATVQRRKLDPFSRQVYFVKRDDAKGATVWAIQTSIDGLRSIAERTGKYDGQDEPEFSLVDGELCCKVKVYRKDWSRPAVGVAFLTEFVQKRKDGSPTRFWATMRRHMLAKCAEALGIRKAFPEDTAGLYIAEEFGQLDNGVTVQTDTEPAAPQRQAQPKQGTVAALAGKAQPPGSKPQQPAAKQTVEVQKEHAKPATSPTAEAKSAAKRAAPPALGLARAKAAWNKLHPDNPKRLTEAEEGALRAVGELTVDKPAPADEPAPGFEQVPSGEEDIPFESPAEEAARKADEESKERAKELVDRVDRDGN